MTEHAPLNVTAGWESVLEAAGRLRLETVELPEYLPKQRWFAGKSRQIKSVRIADWIPLSIPSNVSSDPSLSALVLVHVEFDAGPPDLYFLPLAMSFGDVKNELQRTVPNSIIAPVLSHRGAGLLHDGAFDDQTCMWFFSLIENASIVNTGHGGVRGIRGKAFLDLVASAEKGLQVRRSSAEQSNTSILFGDRFILKLFRRQEPGLNPDAEIGQYLTEKTDFNQIPPFAGSIEVDGLAATDGKLANLALLQGLVANEGDGWRWTLEELDRYYQACAPLPFPEKLRGEFEGPLELSESPPTQVALDHLGLYLEAGAILGRRTAQLHLALATPTDDPAFAPEAFSDVDLSAHFAGIRRHASSVLDLLKERLAYLPDEVVEVAASVLRRRRQILDRFGPLNGDFPPIQRIRIHGDYHLGQVLRVKTDFVILDFEGEPARPLPVRRSKQCPLKDVAGMLRSFSYAAYAGLMNYIARHPEDLTRLEPWAQLWERSAAAEFLRAYHEAAQDSDFLPPGRADFRKLLNVFLLDKALYEVRYELNSRPAWVRIPLIGIMLLVP
ncbi:MAG: putative maltokinase [Candidatus Sulfotelmatobacter sp.]